jgi:hypothetical protein
VAVTVGSTTVNALMYYTSDKQVAALLPSNTPTGAEALPSLITARPAPRLVTASRPAAWES